MASVTILIPVSRIVLPKPNWRTLGLVPLGELKRPEETAIVSEGEWRLVGESTQIRARSDPGAGNVHSGFPNDARSELEP
jgi:hypothetical protein